MSASKEPITSRYLAECLNGKGRRDLERQVLSAAFKLSFERSDSEGAALAHKGLCSILQAQLYDGDGSSTGSVIPQSVWQGSAGKATKARAAKTDSSDYAPSAGDDGVGHKSYTSQAPMPSRNIPPRKAPAPQAQQPASAGAPADAQEQLPCANAETAAAFTIQHLVESTVTTEGQPALSLEAIADSDNPTEAVPALTAADLADDTAVELESQAPSKAVSETANDFEDETDFLFGIEPETQLDRLETSPLQSTPQAKPLKESVAELTKQESIEDWLEAVAPTEAVPVLSAEDLEEAFPSLKPLAPDGARSVLLPDVGEAEALHSETCEEKSGLEEFTFPGQSLPALDRADLEGFSYISSPKPNLESTPQPALKEPAATGKAWQASGSAEPAEALAAPGSQPSTQFAWPEEVLQAGVFAVADDLPASLTESGAGKSGQISPASGGQITAALEKLTAAMPPDAARPQTPLAGAPQTPESKQAETISPPPAGEPEIIAQPVLEMPMFQAPLPELEIKQPPLAPAAVPPQQGSAAASASPPPAQPSASPVPPPPPPGGAPADAAAPPEAPAQPAGSPLNYLDFGESAAASAKSVPSPAVAGASPSQLIKTQTYYQILGVNKMSTYDEIHAKFMRLARRMLRTRNAKNVLDLREFREVLRAICVAHDILMDPVTRTDYDLRQLGMRTEPSAEAPLEAPQGNGSTVPRTRLMIGELLECASILDRTELQIALDMHKAEPGTMFGTFLVKAGFLNPSELESALSGQKLISSGKLTVAQFQTAMSHMRARSTAFFDTLLVEGWITPTDMAAVQLEMRGGAPLPPPPAASNGDADAPEGDVDDKEAAKVSAEHAAVMAAARSAENELNAFLKGEGLQDVPQLPDDAKD